MDKTYRDILKWGDKREQKIDDATLKVIKEIFSLSDETIANKHLFGDTEVKLEKKISLSEKQINDLKELAGDENILTDDFSRANFSYGKYYSDLLFLRKGIIPTPPDVVIAPKSHNDVIKLLTYCNHNKIPIIPVGGQSSVTRGVETPQGGIALDLTKHLNQVLDVNEINMTANVQAGMFGPAFEEHLNKLGYSCGHFPQSFEYSTVGGWVAARGAGQASTGYGKIDDMIVALKVVTPAGVIENKDYPANAEAWDTYPLFVGSEGTLGVITEVIMKIRNLRPENTKYASFVFKSFESATKAMREIMQSDFGTPHLFRISDPEETDIAFKTKGFEEKFSNKVLKALGYLPGKRCLMFVSVEGDASYTKFVKKNIKKTAKKNTGFYIGSGPTKNWLEQRYSSAYMREPLMDIGIMTDTIETAVTWENLLSLHASVRTYVKKREKIVLMSHISHVYTNGANLYFTFLSPMEKGNEEDDYKQFHKGLVDTIHSNNGSLSHHHGIGRVMASRMKDAVSEEVIKAMQAVKNHFDPNGIMNPGGMLGLK
ncbi:MAG: FAD-binding oxidoreductase [Bacteroidetes bacterium]|nr:MAG: FAD-binding oxidoreductase [Bacteroidota bacterium]